jgi:hypothetical protein
MSYPSQPLRCRRGGGGSVEGWVVGRIGVPAGPDDTEPGAGGDADGVRVTLAAGTRARA